MSETYKDQDFTASQRKEDHILLATKARVASESIDTRFYYEPVLEGHPSIGDKYTVDFMGHHFDLPIWISSMTGGTERASLINKNLAKVCGEYKLGMGLGSCRSLLTDNERFADFDVRHLVGDQPLYANLGIAQIERLYLANQLSLINEMLKKLQADGLIIHINPLQEWMQPEGDRYSMKPIELVKIVLGEVTSKVIVKEVGQGMGPVSLLELMSLPLVAVDFGASGGTNFALLELLRDNDTISEQAPFVNIGHDAAEMVDFVNYIIEKHSNDV
ncbi:MAG TPA: isopentenyl-diphosphate delta-isomerase, partial [Saprospiraceae bacterium]|nr:isopentenyl-diphosphate delta-isomerase [Saprospiraceae bacterium]